MLTGIIARGGQVGLFDTVDRERSQRVAKAIDQLNKIHGRDTVKLACQGTQGKYALRQQNRSARFTTRWVEMLVVDSKV